MCIIKERERKRDAFYSLDKLPIILEQLMHPTICGCHFLSTPCKELISFELHDLLHDGFIFIVLFFYFIINFYHENNMLISKTEHVIKIFSLYITQVFTVLGKLHALSKDSVMKFSTLSLFSPHFCTIVVCCSRTWYLAWLHKFHFFFLADKVTEHKNYLVIFSLSRSFDRFESCLGINPNAINAHIPCILEMNAVKYELFI